MRALLDTNVVVSGIFFGGPPAGIIRGWRRGAFGLVVSHEILREYRETVIEASRSVNGSDSTIGSGYPLKTRKRLHYISC
jgi:hypothetical protein